MINANRNSRGPGRSATAVDPDRLLRDAIDRVRLHVLREFLATVLDEPEIHLVLTTTTQLTANTLALPSRHQGLAICGCYPVATGGTYAIQILRRAGELAAYWGACCSEERDVLFVATLLTGTKKLLAPVVVGNANVEDIMFTLVRKPLHRLDERAPQISRILRLAMGCGCADETDGYYERRLEMTVRRALNQAALTGNTSADVTRSQKRSHNIGPRLLPRKSVNQCLA